MGCTSAGSKGFVTFIVDSHQWDHCYVGQNYGDLKIISFLSTNVILTVYSNHFKSFTCFTEVSKRWTHNAYKVRHKYLAK